MNDTKSDVECSSFSSVHDVTIESNIIHHHQGNTKNMIMMGEGPIRFVEIRRSINENDLPPRTIKAYAIEIEPKECSTIVKKLSKELPLPKELEHLKRVRKPIIQDNDTNNSNTATTNTKSEEQHVENDVDPDAIDKKKKKKRPKLLLQILIGRHNQETVDDATKLGLGPPYYEVVVPGRPPESYEEQRQHYNKLWPTNYYPLKTSQHKIQELAITDPNELQFMQNTIETSINSKCVFVVDPTNSNVISRSNEEAKLQKYPNINNPLATPVLFALQGISRLERQSATNLSLKDFSKGQYLCTGYDLYTYYEPTIFEAMSCVHSRLRRLIFFVDIDDDDEHHADVEDSEQQQRQQEGKEHVGYKDNDEQTSTNETRTTLSRSTTTANPAAATKHATAVWTKGCTRHYIHCLPGTNHKFRAFQYIRER